MSDKGSGGGGGKYTPSRKPRRGHGRGHGSSRRGHSATTPIPEAGREMSGTHAASSTTQAAAAAPKSSTSSISSPPSSAASFQSPQTDDSDGAFLTPKSVRSAVPSISSTDTPTRGEFLKGQAGEEASASLDVSAEASSANQDADASAPPIPEKPPRKTSNPKVFQTTQGSSPPSNKELSIEIPSEDPPQHPPPTPPPPPSTTLRRTSSFTPSLPSPQAFSGSGASSNGSGSGSNKKQTFVESLGSILTSFTARQWTMLILFGLADFFSGMIISLQAPFYPPEAERKGATATEFGLVFGVHELTVFAVSPLVGKYMEGIGPKRLTSSGILLSATSCIAFGFLQYVEDHGTFIGLSVLCRILEAVGAAFFVCASFSVIAVEFPSSISTTFASLETFFGLGLIVGPTFGGALFQVGGFLLPFLVTGVALFAVGLLAAFIMPRIQTLPPSDSTPKAKAGILSILAIPGVAAGTLALVVMANSAGFLSATLEPHLRPLALSPLQLGGIFIIYGGVYAATAPILGQIIDRASIRPMWIILTGGALNICAFLLIGPAPFLPLDTSLWIVISGLVLLGLALSCTFVANFISSLQEAMGHGFPDNVQTYGIVSGLWTSAVSLGAFIGPSVGGLLLDNFTFRPSTYYIFGLEGIVIILLLIYLAKTKGGSGGCGGETLPLLKHDEETYGSTPSS